MCERGIEFVDGTAPGFAAITGAADAGAKLVEHARIGLAMPGGHSRNLAPSALFRQWRHHLDEGMAGRQHRQQMHAP
jgi:hypothetical protein